MRSIAVTMLFCALTLLACSRPAPPKSAEAPPPPAVPQEIAGVAQTLLGSDAEVIVFGNLARTGRQQVLAVNRLPTTPAGSVPGSW